MLISAIGRPLPTPYGYGSRLACDQTCERLSRVPVPGQRGQEMLSGGGRLDGADVAVDAGAGEDTDAEACAVAGSGGG